MGIQYAWYVSCRHFFLIYYSTKVNFESGSCCFFNIFKPAANLQQHVVATSSRSCQQHAIRSQSNGRALQAGTFHPPTFPALFSWTPRSRPPSSSFFSLFHVRFLTSLSLSLSFHTQITASNGHGPALLLLLRVQTRVSNL